MVGTTKKRGTKITFHPDDKIFETTEFSFDMLSQRLRELAFLNAGVRITINDEREDEKHHEFFYEGGINSFVEYLNRNRNTLHPKPIYVHGEKEGIEIEIAMQYNDSYDEKIFSFANNINTHEGGTHLIGFKAALTRTMNSYAAANNLLKNEKVSISGEDLREGLTAVISVKIPQPQFEGQTKTKLGNSEVKGYVESLMNEKLAVFLEENPQVAKDILGKVDRGGPSPRGGPQGPRTDPPQGGAGHLPTCRANWPTARKRTRPCANSIWSRAIRPAARPNRGATASSRRSCRSRARFSTSRRPASTR